MLVKKEKIKLIIYDFDGVLTDNKVLVSEDGLESVSCNRADGLAIELIKNAGIPQLILSKETNKIVAARAKKLNIPVLQGIDNKSKALQELIKEKKINLSEVMFLGNDLNDIPVMRQVGFPVCPADAYNEIKETAKLILKTSGGEGVVRELIEYIEKIKQNDKH